MPEPETGWSWLRAGPVDRAPPDEIAVSFAACFASRHGEQVLAHLRARFLDRRCPPGVGDAELRHVEGERCAIAYVLALVARGRALGSRTLVTSVPTQEPS
jgi:hypothetical protein